MTEKEIEEILLLPFDIIFELCRTNREMCRTMISLGIQVAIQKERLNIHTGYNLMFKGYNEVSIAN